MTSSRARWDGVCFFIVALVSFWIHLTFHRWPFDDALIHFRIAEHLIRFGEPYFNAGEAVMGSSSPAWTLLLAALFSVFPATTAVVAGLEATIVAVGCLVWCRWIQLELDDAAAGWIGWGFAPVYLSLVHYSGVGLMETPLALALVGLALLQFRQHPVTGAALLSMASLVRFELAVLWIALATWTLVTRRAHPARVAAGSAVGALPFVAYWLVYFPLLPHTIAAKSLVYEVPWRETLDALTRRALPTLPWLASVELRAALVAVLVAILVGGVVFRGRRSGPAAAGRGPWGLILGAGCAVGCVYGVSGSLLFPWYVPLVGVPIAAIVYLSGTTSESRALVVITLVALVIPHSIALGITFVASFGPIERYPYLAENARVRRYVDVARRLDAGFATATLMSSEVGGLGFGFRGRVVDGMGLVSPEALPYHPLHVPDERSRGSLGAIPPEFVEAIDPEIVVTLEAFGEALLRSPIAERYVDYRFPVYLPADARALGTSELWESRHLHVWLRRDRIRTDPLGATTVLPGIP